MALDHKKLEEIKLQNYFELDKMGEDELTGLVKMAEDAERFEEMALCVNKLVVKRLDVTKEGEEVLSSEQRNQFSVAYKNVVGAKRQALRQLSESKEDCSDEEKMYINNIGQELYNWCKEILVTLEKLVKSAESFKKSFPEEKDCNEDQKKARTDAVEALVFYDKMIGDYYRYLTEEFKKNTSTEDAKEYAKGLKDSCAKAYRNAMDVAQNDLDATNSTRLGLALNFSVAYFEILEQKDKAIELAKKAFDSAIEKLDNLQDAGYKDSTLIMQLLRDNLTIWQNDKDDAEEPDQ